MARRIIDLSMAVHNDMMVFPRVIRPALLMYEDWEKFAQGIGAAQYGVTSLTASCLTVLGDHVGTHIDALKHIVPDAPGPEGIPLEYCYGDGVLLDFRHKENGAGIGVADLEEALHKINYTIKPLDIVFIWTGAGSYNHQESYLREHCGMTREATLWLIEQGVKVMGIDAITFDPPVWAMFERQQFWEAHRVMWEREYYHIENLCNLDQIPRPYGFTAVVLPIKWVGTTGAPVRAVAIVEE
ncbi:MAG: cyclase [Chloroflexi bacterium]|nr:MAG: cyclase [Chloroflexota bacterium]